MIDQETFVMGQEVLVYPFKRSGIVRSVSNEPSGGVLYGIVFEDPERAVMRKRGTVDVYAKAKNLTSLSSTVTIR